MLFKSFVYLNLLFHFAFAKNRHFTSSCDQDTQWNSKDVGERLKDWILSMQPLQLEGESPFEVRFFDENKTRLDLIGKKEGPRKTFWISGGHSFNSNFTNGFFYGHNLNEDGRTMTGEDVVFLYPDMKSVMIGKFEDNVMVSAKESYVYAERCHDNIKEIKVRKPMAGSISMSFVRPTGYRVGGPTGIRDPFEKRTVIVKDTGDSRGQGVFAKRDIAKSEVVCYFGGLLVNWTQIPLIYGNQSTAEAWDSITYAITFQDMVVVLTPSANLWEYRCTLAHKTNHDFVKNNVVNIHGHHPRFGEIVLLEATKDIHKGEEILLDYKFPKDNDLAPKWYLDMYMEQVGRLPYEVERDYIERWG